MARAGYRRAPAERRQALIDAAARALAKHGAGGVSVRTIAAEAEVSPGLVTHHFDGVEPLLAATYRQVSDQVGDALAAAVERAGDDPRARLAAYVAGNFQPPVMDTDLLATWLGLLSLTKSMPLVEVAHAETYAAYRAEVERLLAACRLSGDHRLQAIAITALIDGLWLELCLDDSVFTPAEAIGIARRWLDALLGAAHG
ncbi:MAG TPA: TetR family transcriptional regulator C-terminal domain-containing protein [Sphingomonas sp.]|nr:TetR family transcriptional regulator C-terminal domain-containing protein [Sphingomonas sp.]